MKLQLVDLRETLHDVVGQDLMTADRVTLRLNLVVLFYGAFLPQFIDPQRALLPQFMVMAATFAVAEFLVEMFLARLAHRIRPWLEKRGRRFNQGCGAVFVAFGAALPMTR